MAQNDAKIEGSKEVDYQNIPIPDKDDPKAPPPERWHYTKRRAYLLLQIIGAGNSRSISRTKMAAKFHKNPSTITRDIVVLDEYIADSINPKQVKSMVLASFQRAHQQHINDKDYAGAYHMALSFAAYCQSIGVIEKTPEKLELMGPVEIVIQPRQREDADEEEGYDENRKA